MIQWVILFSRFGKLRLKNWYRTISQAEKNKTINEVISLVLSRKSSMSNFVEHRGTKLVYRRYASLYFCIAIDQDDNELIALEIIHRFVQILDEYFGNVCELDIIYGMNEAFALLNEFLIAGEVQEPTKRIPIHAVLKAEAFEQDQLMRDTLNNVGLLT